MKNKFFEKILNSSTMGTGDSDKHLLTLFSIALSLDAKKILELGVRSGSTTLPFLMAMDITNGHLESVDIDSTSFDCPKEFKSRWKFRKRNALDFLEEKVSLKEKYDLIYVDDWHSYEHVKKELEFIDQLVTPSSVVLLHDLMYGNTCPYYHVDLTNCSPQWSNGGPYRAVAELNPNFWEFSTIPSNNGLTILRKKYSSKY
ncbi:MAG: class I SAM-dependent methyltransferase [Verrucomicrobia bacterium]|nr:class I SAM-dependent methyltransferase [Verrucomicrobiota bacterium]